LATITDRRIQYCGAGEVMYYKAQVVTMSDYYPFGMKMESRTMTNTGNGYRFGFNGKENESEAFSGCIAFEARIYDSRLGRFLSADPLEGNYPWQSTYVFAINSPITLIDFLGMGPGKGRKLGDKAASGKGASTYAAANVPDQLGAMTLSDKMDILGQMNNGVDEVFEGYNPEGTWSQTEKDAYWANEKEGYSYMIQAGNQFYVPDGTNLSFKTTTQEESGSDFKPTPSRTFLPPRNTVYAQAVMKAEAKKSGFKAVMPIIGGGAKWQTQGTIEAYWVNPKSSYGGFDAGLFEYRYYPFKGIDDAYQGQGQGAHRLLVPVVNFKAAQFQLDFTADGQYVGFGGRVKASSKGFIKFEIDAGFRSEVDQAQFLHNSAVIQMPNWGQSLFPDVKHPKVW
jgi:RHS repeat-associated protein